MKFISLFTKTPTHRKFSYAPRFYDPREEERREREARIRSELQTQPLEPDPQTEYHARIKGSFKNAKRAGSRQINPSAVLIRLILLTFLTLWLVAFIHFGFVAFYGLLLIIPFYFVLKYSIRPNNQSGLK